MCDHPKDLYDKVGDLQRLSTRTTTQRQYRAAGVAGKVYITNVILELLSNDDPEEVDVKK